MCKSYADILRERIAKISDSTRAGLLNMEDRKLELAMALDDYALAFADQYEPERELAKEKGRVWAHRYYDANLLEKAANLLLHEELTSTLKNKASATEYPFLSDMQIRRRQSGAHDRKNKYNLGETDFINAETIGQDGRNYKRQSRRKLSTYEALNVDAGAAILNKERKKAYAEFTKAQPIKIFKLNS